MFTDNAPVTDGNDALAMGPSKGPLSLVAQERIIRGAMGKAIYDIGGALLVIRDGRLYRAAGFAQFEQYCAQVWGYHRSRVYQCIDFHVVVRDLSTNVDMRGVPLPQTEAQTRPLLRLKTTESQVTVWKEVLDRHGERATMAQAQAIVDRHLAIGAGDQCGDRRERRVIAGGTAAAPAPVALSDEGTWKAWDLGGVRTMVGGLYSDADAWVAAIPKVERPKVNDLIGDLRLLADALERALECHAARGRFVVAEEGDDGERS